MRQAGWLAAVAALCLWCPRAASGGNKEFKLDKRRKALQAVSYKNLTLFPVVSSRASQRDFTVLDSGMKAGKVKVLETGNVNNLTVVNNSTKPLFLMAGEVVIGGKQDRIIGKDTIVPARTKEGVPVYCVEHGRWSGRKTGFRSAGSLAHTKLRKRAKYSNQSKVWSEVNAKNKMRATDNATQTYRKIATGKKTRAAVNGYARHFEAKLAALFKRKDVVGFVVVLDGRVVAVETFRSNRLFRRMKNKLLRSYYVEAVDATHTRTAAKVGAKQVRGFLAKAKAAKRRVVYSAKGARTYQFNGSGVVGSSVTMPGKRRPSAKKSPAAKPAADEYTSVYAE
jgi:hypothetical protein